MGVYKYLTKLWNKPKAGLGALYREKIIQWNQGPASVRLERPTRLDRARSLGYKAKQGYIVVRQRVLRGGHWRPVHGRGGRRSKHYRMKMTLSKNYQSIAEERAGKGYPNCEVLNSYWVGKNNMYYWYEVILVDKNHPVILADKNISWIAKPQHRGRVFRGLTSAARKSRGLR
jgi:large subunit ribosomal protein L15e